MLENKSNEKIILEKKYSKKIYNASYLCLISFLYAIKKQQFKLSIVPMSIFITSINHWRNPIIGWRRNLDIVTVYTGITYNIINAYYIPNNRNKLMYYCILSSSMSCYPLSLYLYNNNNILLSTYSHVILHVLANISNLILYKTIN